MNNCLLIGSQYHCEQVSENVFRDNSNSFRYDNINNAKTFNGFLHFILNILWAKSIVFIYAPVSSYLFSLFLFGSKLLGKKVSIIWIGTDVLDFKKIHTGFRAKLIKTLSNHYCECDWISEELRDLGINAKIGPYITYSTLFKNDLIQSDDLVKHERSEKFSVLSYAGKGRENFYGIDKIIATAAILPEIEFLIVGTNGEGLEYHGLKNIKFFGWIPKQEMNELYVKSIVMARLTEHDGLSYSVLEALHNKLVVLFSYDYPNTIKINTTEELTDALKNLYEQWLKGQLSINDDGYNFVYREFIKNNNCIERFQMDVC